MSTFNKDESVAKATKNLMLKESFYGLFLMQMNKSWSDRIPTAGVGKNGINIEMVINEPFWESLTDLWRMMVLKANVLNVVFHHIEIGANLPDKEIMSIASSIVVNQYIDPSWLPLFDVKWKDFVELNKELFELWRRDIASGKMSKEEAVEEFRKIPPRGIYLQDFPELKMEEKKGLKYYYDILKKAENKEPGKGGSQALNELLQNRQDNLPDNWYKDFEEFKGMSEAESKLLRSQLDFQLKEVAEQVTKSRGTIPGELSGYIDALNRTDPPKFDWRGYLRRFVGGSQRVDVLRTRAKPNLRYPHAPGRRIRPRAHILIGIDTSGSVSNDELKEFFHEVYHMTKMGNDVTIVQFDASISNIAKYKKGLEDKVSVFGRGGTDFTPVCNYSIEHRRDFSCLVVFTDGEAPPPDQSPTMPCLWVHSSTSKINPGLPGFSIKLPN